MFVDQGDRVVIAMKRKVVAPQNVSNDIQGTFVKHICQELERISNAQHFEAA
jgi:hypothetical protein